MKLILRFLIAFTFISNCMFSQWQQTGGPYLADPATCFANTPTSLFCGTYGYGIYKSSNLSSSWSVLNPSTLPSTSLLSLFVDGTSIYAGIDQNGCYLSTNDGSSWVARNNGLPSFTTINKFTKQGSAMFISSNNGCYKSSNNGLNWSAISAFPYPCSSVSFINNKLFLSQTNDSLYVSSDGGNTWASCMGLPLGLSVTCMDTLHGNIYAASNYGLFVSPDSGLSWNLLSNGIPSDISSVCSNGNVLLAVSVSSGAYTSTDDGATWINQINGLYSNNFFASYSFGNNLIISAENGIYISSDNGVNWSVNNQSLLNTYVWGLFSHNTDLFAGLYFYGGSFISQDNGVNWNHLTLPTGSTHVFCFTASSSRIFAGTGANGIYYTTNNGSSWTSCNTGLFTNEYISTLNYNGSKLFAGTIHGVYTSTNNGASWQAKNNGITGGLDVRAFDCKGDTLVVSTGGGLFVSSNGGLNWTSANNGLPPTTASFGFEGLVFRGTSIIAASTAGVYISNDFGQTWSPINTGLTNTNINCMISSGIFVFVGTTTGQIYYTINNGVNWTLFSSGLPALSIPALTVHNNKIYAATDGNGVWVSNLPLITTVTGYEQEEKILLYPNPAQNILYTNANSGFKIYDVLGNLCLQGNNSEVITLESLKGGVYFIELYVSDTSKKLRFIKE